MGRVKDRNRHLATLLRLRKGPEGAPKVASSHVQLSGQQPHQSETPPHSPAKAGEQLLTGMIKGWLDGVNGGDGHKTSLLRAS